MQPLGSQTILQSTDPAHIPRFYSGGKGAFRLPTIAPAVFCTRPCTKKSPPEGMLSAAIHDDTYDDSPFRPLPDLVIESPPRSEGRDMGGREILCMLSRGFRHRAWDCLPTPHRGFITGSLQCSASASVAPLMRVAQWRRISLRTSKGAAGASAADISADAASLSRAAPAKQPTLLKFISPDLSPVLYCIWTPDHV